MKKMLVLLPLIALVGCVSKPLTDAEYAAQQSADKIKETISLRQEQAECTYSSNC